MRAVPGDWASEVAVVLLVEGCSGRPGMETPRSLLLRGGREDARTRMGNGGSRVVEAMDKIEGLNAA